MKRTIKTVYNKVHYPLTMCLIVIIWTVCMIPVPETPLSHVSFIDKWTHFVMYGVLTATIWIEYALTHPRPSWPRLITGGIVLPMVMGGLVELAQAYLTTCRSGDWFDALCNSLGVLLGAAVAYFLISVNKERQGTLQSSLYNLHSTQPSHRRGELRGSLILSTFPKTGGAAIAAGRLLRALNNNGVMATMLSRHNLTLPGWKERWGGVPFLIERMRIWLANGMSRRNLFAVDIANCGEDVTRTREFREAGVIHLHWVSQGFISLDTLEKIVNSGKRIVWTMHDQWPMTGVCHYSDGCDKFRSECRECPLMAGDDGKELAREVFERKRGLYAKGNITFVACSRWLASMARQSALGRDADIVAIPNPIDTETFKPQDKAAAREALGLPKDKTLILFGCQKVTDKRKGLDYLAKALEALDGVGVVLVGGHADATKALLPQNVEVTSIGQVGDTEVMARLYAAVDTFVTPSLQDNLPNTIMEAMACGTPCVGFNVGGIPEMIDHMENGYVAEYKNAGDLAAGIRYVTDKANAQRLANKAREKVLREYSEKTVAEKYAEVYKAQRPLSVSPRRGEGCEVTNNSLQTSSLSPHSPRWGNTEEGRQVDREGRWATLVFFIFFTIINAINVCGYWSAFSKITSSYHSLFVRTYCVSGFDPLTYRVISDWFPAYNIYRHPLLAFFMYPFYLINQGLMWLTGVNCAVILTAMILIFCSTMSFVLLYRILRNIIGIGYWHTLALAALYFSFGFIILSSMVPDHFVMSQCCLLLTIWLAGKKLKRGSALNMWQTIGLFTLTAGISLNNGLKVFLAALVTRRRRFFNWKFLLLAVVLPAGLMWAVAKWEYKTWQWPKEKARSEAKARKDKAAVAKLRSEVLDTISDKSPAAVNAAVKRIRNERAMAKYRADHKKIWNRNTGKPIAKEGFMKWTDTSTSRCDAAVENLFGEAIQLHRDNALGDVFRNRPVVVRYSGLWRYANYAVETAVVMLFLAGIWCGRRELLMWTAMSFFLMDMALHMGLGFGINEIYIMSAHYLFVVPVAMAYIIKRNARRTWAANAVGGTAALLALWCLAWNMTVICHYFAE